VLSFKSSLTFYINVDARIPKAYISCTLLLPLNQSNDERFLAWKQFLLVDFPSAINMGNINLTDLVVSRTKLLMDSFVLNLLPLVMGTYVLALALVQHLAFAFRGCY
jgi:hypothetical protein